jgi:RNase P/RNase MRP subunit POP5
VIREKKRYVLFKIEFEGGKLSRQQVIQALNEAVSDFLGELGLSKARLKLLEFDEGKQEGVFRCSNEELEKVIAAVALKRFFEERGIALRTTKASALINRVWKNGNGVLSARGC